jgi:hypothetical protein
VVFAEFINELAEMSDLVFEVGNVVICGWLSSIASAMPDGSRHGIVRMLAR